MRKLSLQEQHVILLELAKIFDKICTDNDIPYYMLGGTMLGAIRHKGFIPWDDDMDFGVPHEYFGLLKAKMEEQLPPYFRFCDYENCDSIFMPFAKLSDTRTILDDKQIPLPLEDKIGINIDIFPLYKCNKGVNVLRIQRLLVIGGKIYTDSRTLGKPAHFMKKIARVLCPLPRKWFLRKADYRAKTLPKGPYLANIYGRWKDKETCLERWYGNNVRYKFETLELCGFKEYDLYLKQMYGDYMKMPPKEMQFIHSENAYIKE